MSLDDDEPCHEDQTWDGELPENRWKGKQHINTDWQDAKPHINDLPARLSKVQIELLCLPLTQSEWYDIRFLHAYGWASEFFLFHSRDTGNIEETRKRNHIRGAETVEHSSPGLAQAEKLCIIVIYLPVRLRCHTFALVLISLD
jgi:hypothetical protein